MTLAKPRPNIARIVGLWSTSANDSKGVGFKGKRGAKQYRDTLRQYQETRIRRKRRVHLLTTIRWKLDTVGRGVRPIFVDFELGSAAVRSTGYEGVPWKDGKEPKLKTVQELEADGFRVLKARPNCTRLFVTRKGRRLVGSVTWPKGGPSQEADIASMNAVIEEGAADIRATCRDRPSHRPTILKHRKDCKKGKRQALKVVTARGDFMAYHQGVFMGGGRVEPGKARNPAVVDRVLKRVVAHPSFQRVAGFMSASLGAWAPRIHHHMRRTIGALERRHPSLRRPFPNTPFPAMTINFGPRTVCQLHRDGGNLPSALCAITSLGAFDASKGGHLVLWEYKLVVECPPGTTILIPSAFVTHGNTPISTGERRYSFTQYASGGLFRWVDNGFQSNTTLFEGMGDDDFELWMKNTGKVWKEGMKRFKVWHG